MCCCSYIATRVFLKLLMPLFFYDLCLVAQPRRGKQPQPPCKTREGPTRSQQGARALFHPIPPYTASLPPAPPLLPPFGSIPNCRMGKMQNETKNGNTKARSKAEGQQAGVPFFPQIKHLPPIQALRTKIKNKTANVVHTRSDPNSPTVRRFLKIHTTAAAAAAATTATATPETSHQAMRE